MNCVFLHTAISHARTHTTRHTHPFICSVTSQGSYSLLRHFAIPCSSFLPRAFLLLSSSYFATNHITTALCSRIHRLYHQLLPYLSGTFPPAVVVPPVLLTKFIVCLSFSSLAFFFPSGTPSFNCAFPMLLPSQPNVYSIQCFIPPCACASFLLVSLWPFISAIPGFASEHTYLIGPSTKCWACVAFILSFSVVLPRRLISPPNFSRRCTAVVSSYFCSVFFPLVLCVFLYLCLCHHPRGCRTHRCRTPKMTLPALLNDNCFTM